MKPRPPAALPVVCTRSGLEVRWRPTARMVAHPSLNCSSLAGAFHFSTTKDASVLRGRGRTLFRTPVFLLVGAHAKQKLPYSSAVW